MGQTAGLQRKQGSRLLRDPCEVQGDMKGCGLAGGDEEKGGELKRPSESRTNGTLDHWMYGVLWGPGRR